MKGSNRAVVIKPVGKNSRSLRADLRGDDAPGGGVGGWEEVSGGKRGQQNGLAFKGSPSYTLALPLGFNGLEVSQPGSSVSVEPQCRRLVDLGRPTKKGGRPPLLHVHGLIRTPSTIEWVIDSIEWDAQIRNASGARVQQLLTLNLIQWRKPPAKKSPAKKSKT